MKATVICNPAAGLRSSRDELLRTIGFLRSQGVEISAVMETHGPGDARTYARRAAAQGDEVVFLAGGDGTIAQGVDGLVGSETALAVLPGGSGNVFARQLHLPVPGGLVPRPLLESARLLLAGQARRVDVGAIASQDIPGPAHHFLCWGGIGFDAEVNRVVAADTRRKRRLGTAATIITTLFTLRYFAGTSTRMQIDDQRVNRRLMMLVASNIQLYGIVFRMSEHAVIDDGMLDVVCFRGSKPLQTAAHFVHLLLNKHIADPAVDFYRARRVEVHTNRPLPVHVDGDYIGNTPVTIEIVPKALSLLVPTCAPASLFVDGAGMLPRESRWARMQRNMRAVQSAINKR